MIKKFIKVFSLIVMLLVVGLSSTCFAAVTVTEENLKTALQEFQASEANEDGYTITMANNIISVTLEGETYNLSYDISGEKPTFTYEVPIQKGMSYDEFEKKCGDALMLPMIGYIAVANIQGVELEDATTYFTFAYLSAAMGSGSISLENSYIIVDDLNVSEGVTIQKDPNDTKTIYTSEFGDRVIEYTNSLYKEKQTMQDSEGITSFIYTLENTEKTDTSCKLISKIEVDVNADYSKLNGYLEQKIGVSKDNADYVVNLKVGQKCKLETKEKISGHGGDFSCIEFNDDKTEITALKVGKVRGTLYLGNNAQIKKTIYITIEENPGNTILDTITVNLDSPKDTVTEKNEIDKNIIITDEDKENTISNKVEKEDNSSDDLPQTGLNNFILIASIIIGVIAIIITGTKMKKYKEIK